MSTASLWGDQTFPDLEFPLWKAVTAVAMGLATAACGTRLYVRGSMVGKIGVDDYILVVAYISFMALCGLYLAVLATARGQGYVDNYYGVILLGQFAMWLSSITTVLIRAAIAWFFLRVFSNRGVFHNLRIAMISIFVLYATYEVVIAFVTLMQCGASSVSDLDGENANAVCLNTYTLANVALASLVLTTATDWLMTLIPAVIVFRSTMEPRQKVSTMCVILLGAVGGAVSIVRIPFNSLGNTFSPADVPGYCEWFVLAIAENWFGLTAISLAALKPLFKKVQSAHASDNSDTQLFARQQSTQTDGEKKIGMSIQFMQVVSQ